MNLEYAMSNKNNGNRLIKVACTIVFLLFSFCYVNYYQDDVLLISQHILSGGQTHYVKSIGSPLIVAVLWLLQIVACRLSGVNKRAYWLTFMPSFVLLAAITDVRCISVTDCSWGPWCWLLPVMWLLAGLLLWLARQLQPYEPETVENPLLSRNLWNNMLAIFMMMFLTCVISNPDEIYHYRTRMEVLISQKKYEEALRVGERSLDSDTTLTSLRLYALAQTGQLGDKLFEYPLVGGSASMNPMDKNVHLLLLDAKALSKQMKSAKFRRDDQLCSLLLDRKLDDFAVMLLKTYKVNASLPKHYKEALYLYTHTRSHPVVTMSDNVMDADFEDFEKLVPTTESAVRDAYGNTYWYYYKYKH